MARLYAHAKIEYASLRSTHTCFSKQELSYRKQIARQLRTQYAEGIYDNPMTLKSRLTVTQGHWKRNQLSRSDTTYY